MAEHFESVERKDQAAHLGMWLFLASEVLLFGALFAVYAGYRVEFGYEFVVASSHNSIAIGTTNTFVLVTSSLFAALAVHAARSGRLRRAAGLLALTIGCGLLFLGLKAVEYGEHFRAGILPGNHYHYAALPTHAANAFFTLYYLMTGLHALHVTGGMVALGAVGYRAFRGAYSAERHLPLELAVLYWHLVDVIWLFLWPLLYLMH
ncbi:MAG TPA: cytochrome c oxidase subunit 3 family protein [Polyangiaceae bacterium]|nr:cytochrome c oxidase subunit 3 family protein [Polyangiaceae bacterium]